VLDGTEYEVSFTGMSDAAEEGNAMVLDGTEYAVSFKGVPDAAEAEEALPCGQEREDTENAES
jgi:hypothetical protein